MEPTAASGSSGMSKKMQIIMVVAMCAIALVASSCAQPPSTAKLQTPPTVASPIAALSPPPGGAVPAELLGDWFLQPAAIDAVIGCPSPVKAEAACALRLHLMPTTYSFAGTLPPGPGQVVVNATEIDFFSALQCIHKLPDGIGRYRWTLAGGVLHLAPLNDDPCGRSQYLVDQSFYRTP